MSLITNPALTLEESSSSSSPPSPEDILSQHLPHLFGPSSTPTSHGTPGQRLIYRTAQTTLTLTLPTPTNESHRRLFAHYIWNGALILSSLIEEQQILPVPTTTTTTTTTTIITPNNNKRRQQQQLDVIELGAGTGLCGLVAANVLQTHYKKHGEEGRRRSLVVLTDYPAKEILDTLRGNAVVAAQQQQQSQQTRLAVEVQVRGHKWGDVSDANGDCCCWVKEQKGRFGVILLADCLWLLAEHKKLLRSLKWFLKRPDGRVWLTAGFHTGREKVGRFFDLVEDEEEEEEGEGDGGGGGLMIERIWERDVDGYERDWVRVRMDEDLDGRMRWVVCAVLKWR